MLGAAHVYLWGGKLLSQYDVTDWKAFATQLSLGGDDDTVGTVGRHIFSQLNTEAQDVVRDIVRADYSSNYSRNVVSRALSEQLEKPDFYNPSAWTEISLCTGNRKVDFAGRNHTIASRNLQTQLSATLRRVPRHTTASRRVGGWSLSEIAGAVC